MNVLKGFGVGILSFLLFCSLAVFGIAFTVHSTLLNPDFIAAEVDRVDVSALVSAVIEERVSAELPPEAQFLKTAIRDVVSDQEPWIKQQVNAAIYSAYDFLLGRSERLSIVISLEPLKAGLRDSLWQTFSDYLSSDLSTLPEYIIKPFFEQYYEEFAEQIPDGAEVVLLDSRDSKYNRHMLTAIRTAPPEHPVVYIEVGELAPVRSRLRNPRVLPAPTAYALA